MKAQFIKLENRSEIVLANGTTYRSKKNEDPDDFYVRIADKVDTEHLEPLEIDYETDTAKMKKKSTVQLKSRLAKAGPLEKDGIEEILVERGEMDAPKAKAKTKTKAKSKKSPGRPKVEKPSDKELAAEQERGKENVGKTASFTPRGEEEQVTGTIKGLMTDKRVNLAYYRIVTPENKTHHKRVGSEEITIH